MNQELNRCSKEIKELEREKDKHAKESQAKGLEARKLTHKLKEWEKESKENAKFVTAMVRSNPWIEKEKEFFGQEGSDFDFKARDVTQCAKRHKQLKAEQVCASNLKKSSVVVFFFIFRLHTCLLSFFA
jgi:structural maintenance of chromosome 2